MIMNLLRTTSIVTIVLTAMSACTDSSDRPPEGVLQGLRTVVYGVPDVNAGKSWYTQALRIEPYFSEPFYVGYNVGGYELGLDPDRPAAQPEGSGPIVYWGVDDVETELRRLLELGATPHTPFQDVGGGIKVGSVIDPFGNAIGLIYNPHFKSYD